MPRQATLLEDGSVVLNLLGAVRDVDGVALTITSTPPASTPVAGDSLFQTVAAPMPTKWARTGWITPAGASATCVQETPVMHRSRRTRAARPPCSYTAQASDVDGDTLSYSLSQAPSGASINSQTGVLTWSTTAPGNYNFTISVSDGKGGVALQVFTLLVKAPATATTPNTTPVTEPGCASIVVRSGTYSVASDDNGSKAVRYIVVNGGGSTVTTANSGNASGSVVSTATASDSALRVDWSGAMQQTTSLSETDDWVSDFLGTAPDHRSLAEKTGLVVNVKG